jgi:hypothetical protein
MNIRISIGKERNRRWIYRWSDNIKMDVVKAKILA